MNVKNLFQFKCLTVNICFGFYIQAISAALRFWVVLARHPSPQPHPVALSEGT